MSFDEIENKTSRRDKLANAQLAMISTTGKISGEVKEILYCEDKDKMTQSIEVINENLKKLILEIYDISNALNLDIKEILGELYGNI